MLAPRTQSCVTVLSIPLTILTLLSPGAVPTLFISALSQAVHSYVSRLGTKASTLSGRAGLTESVFASAVGSCLVKVAGAL